MNIRNIATPLWMLFLFFLCFTYPTTQLYTQSEAEDCIDWYTRMGEEMFDKGRYDSVLYFFKKRLPYCKKNNNHKAAINSTNWITYIYDAMGVMDSLEFYQKVAESHAEELAKVEPYAEDLYKYNNTYARFYEIKREISKKLEYLKKAQSILKNQADSNTSHLIISYQNLATAYEDVGDHYTALEYATYANKLLQKHTEDEQELSDAVSILNTIGFQYMHLSNYDEALRYYEKAINLAERLEEKNITVAFIFANLGYLYFEHGDYVRAIKLVRKAMRLLEALDQKKHYVYAACNRVLGQCAMKQGRKVAALQFLSRAKEFGLKHQGFKSYITGGNFKVLADFYRENNPDLALDYYQKSLSALVLEFNDTMDISANPILTQTCYSKPRFLEILEAKGSLLLERGCHENALLCYRRLDELMFDMRRSYQAESSKFLLQEKAIPIYEKAIEVALQLDETETALRFAERSKAVFLLEATKDKNARSFVGLPEELLQQEEKYKMDIAYLQREKYGQQSDSENSAELDAHIFLLSKQKQELVERLEKEFPRYYHFKYADVEISIDHLQENLDNDEAMLHYFYGLEKLYVFGITKKQVGVQELEINAAIEEKVYNLLENIEAREESCDAFLEYGNMASALYDFLLKNSVAQFAGNIKKLRIIPDGVLRYLPFQVLVKNFDEEKFSTHGYDELDYVVRDFSISYSYSSSVRNAIRQVGDGGNFKVDFAGFAPVFDGKKIASNGRDVPKKLLASVKEVESVNDLFGGKTFLRKEASAANFKRIAGRCKVLHLATHATLGEHTMSSKIHFYDDYITVGEIYSLPEMNTRLAVLSACRTARGKLKRGEGIMSIARAFGVAGCPATLSCLWSVPDGETSDLMVSFYENLMRGKTHAAALNVAQQNYLQKEVMTSMQAHPFRWGAFVLFE